MEIVKKGLVFAAIPYAVLKVYLLSMFRTCPVETVKSCILSHFQILISQFFIIIIMISFINSIKLKQVTRNLNKPQTRTKW